MDHDHRDGEGDGERHEPPSDRDVPPPPEHRAEDETAPDREGTADAQHGPSGPVPPPEATGARDAPRQPPRAAEPGPPAPAAAPPEADRAPTTPTPSSGAGSRTTAPGTGRAGAAGARPARPAHDAPAPRKHRLPPGPSRPAFWRSPLRGRWLTSVLGLVLLVGLTAVTVTGLLSYAAYNPGLGPPNDKTPDKGLLGFYLFPWPTSPYWLYRLTQGVHVILGLALIPVLLAKLWSVIPRLFAWPPVRSVNHALERISLLLLVGGALFEFATGVLNVQLEYVFPGSFYPLHFYGAWVFLAALVVHVTLRVGTIRRALRGRSLWEELRTPTRRTGPEPDDESGLVSPTPATPTISRRGVLGMVGLGSLVMVGVTAGQSIGGALRDTALLAPRGQDPGPGPNGFQVNKTAEARGIRDADVGPGWRLTVEGRGGRETVLSRAELLELPQHTARLPIACVEGWSTDDQEWTGVRLSDLAALVGHDTAPPGVFVESLQPSGSFRSAALRDNQVRDPRSLLALRVNGADLSLDHGYPARIIVPANPGVHNTKWVARLAFGDQESTA